MQHEKSVSDSSDIFAKTLRTVAVLVGACVLFVGLLSTAAVVIASKAVAPAPHAASVELHEVPAKKPLSI